MKTSSNRGDRTEVILAPKNFQIARAHKRLTVSDLAKLVGVSRQYLSGLETGRVYINQNRAVQIAEILNSSVDSLFEVRDQKFFVKKGETHESIRSY